MLLLLLTCALFLFVAMMLLLLVVTISSCCLTEEPGQKVAEDGLIGVLVDHGGGIGEHVVKVWVPYAFVHAKQGLGLLGLIMMYVRIFVCKYLCMYVGVCMYEERRGVRREDLLWRGQIMLFQKHR